MSTWQGSDYLVSYELGAISTLIISIVMLRSTVFTRTTAHVGIATAVTMFWPPVNDIGIVISLVSLAPLVMWYVLIARRLFQLAQDVPREAM